MSTATVSKPNPFAALTINEEQTTTSVVKSKPLPVLPHTAKWGDAMVGDANGSVQDLSEPAEAKADVPPNAEAGWVKVTRKGDIKKDNPYPGQKPVFSEAALAATAKAKDRAPAEADNDTVYNLQPQRKDNSRMWSLCAEHHGDVLAQNIKTEIRDYMARHPNNFEKYGWKINGTGHMDYPFNLVKEYVEGEGYPNREIEKLRMGYLFDKRGNRKPNGFWPHPGQFEPGGFNYTPGNSLRECTLRSLEKIKCKGVFIQEYTFIEYNRKKTGFYIWVEPLPNKAV